MPATLSTTDQILLATERVVLRDGISSLTIDAVAREASLSKGGVLYHFPSKERLIEGLVRRLIDHFEATLTRYHTQEGQMPGAYTRAFVRTTLQPATSSCGSHCTEVFAVLTAALVTNPQLLSPLRCFFAQCQQRIEQDGIDPARATLVRLAADGLWFAELLGFGPPPATLREKVLHELVELTRPEEIR